MDLFALGLKVTGEGLPELKAGLAGVDAQGLQAAESLTATEVASKKLSAAAGEIRTQAQSTSAALEGTARASNDLAAAQTAATSAGRQATLELTNFTNAWTTTASRIQATGAELQAFKLQFEAGFFNEKLITGMSLAGQEAEKAGAGARKWAAGLAAMKAEAVAATPAVEGLALSGEGLLAAFEPMIAIFAAFKWFEFVKSTIEGAAAIEELSKKTGASVEMLSVLEFAGKRAEVSVGAITAALRGLSLALGRLREGQKQAVDGFGQLGLSARDFVGLNTDQAFHKLVDAIGRLPDGLNKSEVAAKVFGRSGAQLIPLLDELAHGGFQRATEEATKLGAVISADTAEKADKFHDAVQDLTGALSGLMREVLLPILPPLTTFVKLLALAVKYSKDLAVTTVTGQSQLGLSLGQRLKQWMSGAPAVPEPTRDPERSLGHAAAPLLPPEKEEVSLLVEQLKLGKATNDERERAVALVERLRVLLLNQNLSDGQRLELQHQQNELETALGQRTKDRIAQQTAEINALKALAGVRELSAGEIARLRELETSLTNQLERKNLTRVQELRLTKDLIEVQKILAALLPLDTKNLGALNDLAATGDKALTAFGARSPTGERGNRVASSGGLVDSTRFGPQPLGILAGASPGGPSPKTEADPDDPSNRIAAWLQAVKQQASAVSGQFAQVGTNLAMVIGNGFAAGLAAALHGKNPFKAFGNVVLQGLGSLMSQMGQALIRYGIIMLNLLPFLANVFTSGPAAIAAGIALAALGTTLGGIATGAGGGGGSSAAASAASTDQTIRITLTPGGQVAARPAAAQAVAIAAPPTDVGRAARVPQPVPIHQQFFVVGAHDPIAQRTISELAEAGSRRGFTYGRKS